MSMDLEVLEIPISRKVLVSGAGVVACTAALELSKAGYDVILSSPEPDIRGHGQLIWGGEDHPPTLIESMTHDIEGAPGIEIVTSADILACEGSTGQFTIKIKAGNKTILKEVGAVILANEPECVADFGAWRLEESERIRSLSWLEKALDSSADHPLVSGEKPNRIVFLSGFIHQANPFSQKRAIDSALKLAANQTNQIFFLTEHFKVAHQGMERLTRKAREAGVLFVKLTDMRPEIRAEGDRVEIFYYDEGMESEISLYPDYIILEEAYRPPKENARFEERFGFNLDPTQKETVYNRPIYTTRSGIWVTGPAKGPLSMEEGIEEAKAVALEVHRFLGTGSQVSAERRLLFNDSRCGRCLTCYRLCPHRAISPSQGRPTFFDLSCKACGICAAGCPADAIQIASFTDDDLNSQIVNALANSREVKAPNLIAFCCENSAFEAARLAAFRGLGIPEGLNLIKVPCAGRVDLDHLFRAFEMGADGVMVLGCHDESCKSMRGNILAERRSAMVRGVLKELGMEGERLFFGTLAPAMGFEFARMVREMETAVRDLGSNPVRGSLKET